MAYQLTRKGKQVDVYDQVEKLGSPMQASSVNCGIMCSAAHTQSTLGKLLFRESLKIAKNIGADAKWTESGSLEILMTEEECEWARSEVTYQRAIGHGEDQIVYLEKDKVHEVDPNLGPDILGAIYFPNEGHVNPKKMTMAVGRMAMRQGAKIHLNQKSISFNDGVYQVKMRSNLNTTSNTLCHT